MPDGATSVYSKGEMQAEDLPLGVKIRLFTAFGTKLGTYIIGAFALVYGVGAIALLVAAALRESWGERGPGFLLGLTAGALAAACGWTFHITWSAVVHAAIQLAPRELSYWDLKGERHTVPWEAIESISVSGMAFRIDYDAGSGGKAVTMWMKSSWDSGIEGPLLRMVREKAELVEVVPPPWYRIDILALTVYCRRDT